MQRAERLTHGPAQTVTDMGYTGHRHNNQATANDLGLIYMNARYYLPHLGRFASPDTLVPDPANPQSYNRYAYVRNNPLAFTDPTGHCGTEFSDAGYDLATANDQANQCRQLRSNLESLLGYSVKGVWYLWQIQAFLGGAQHMQAQGMPIAGSLNDDAQRAALQNFVGYMASTEMTSLGISALTTEFAWVLRTDIEDLIAVLSGHEGDGLDRLQPSALGPYNTFAGYGLKTTGFGAGYKDPDATNNQVHHTWFYVQLGYYHGDLIAWLGNVKHEVFDSGNSIPDYRAGNWGIRAGDAVRRGVLNLPELARSLRTDLASD